MLSRVLGFSEGARPTLEDAVKQFETADVKLNAAYQSARSDLSPVQFKALKNFQKEWLVYRDYKAKDLLWFNENVEEETPQQLEKHPEYWVYKTFLTNERAEYLQVYSGKNVQPGITGNYQDFNGGSLQLTETKKGLLFYIDVVRGRTAHGGEISGLAKKKGNVAVYRTRVSDGKWCEITFTFKKPHVIGIEAKNDQEFRGMRAFFDGIYFKTNRPLIKGLSVSPDQRYGVQVPVSTFSEDEGSDAKNELGAMNSLSVIGTIDTGKEPWRVGREGQGINKRYYLLAGRRIVPSWSGRFSENGFLMR